MPMQETRNQSLGQRDPLEKDMATHSSVIAWEIPWQAMSIWSQRVGHNLEIKQQQQLSKIENSWKEGSRGRGWIYVYL